MKNSAVKSLHEFERKAEQIEGEKEQKVQEREQKKQAKSAHQQQIFREKMLAPILLIITIIISYLVLFF